VIVAEVTFDFKPRLPVMSFVSPTVNFNDPVGVFTVKRTIYARPRRSLTVNLTQ
jgi:hypothetical protein